MKSKLRDAEEIDVVLDCSCGVSFRVYLPNTPYECPNCHNLYSVELTLKNENGNSDDWRMVGVATDE